MRPQFPTASMFANKLPWHVMLRIRLLWLFGFRCSVRLDMPKWEGPWWFNLGIGTVHFYFPPGWGLPGLCIFPWNAFNRVFEDETENCWGFGLLQINKRHLLAVISNSERFQVDVGFVHVVLQMPREARTT